jgi:tetratricopeptide (TPR) repeat protein
MGGTGGALNSNEPALEDGDGSATTGDPVALVVELAEEAWQTRLAGRYVDARQKYAEVLDLAESTLPSDAPALVRVLNGIGVLGKYAGDFDGAAAAYRRAVQIEAGREHPDPDVLANLLHNVGGLEHARGEHRSAEHAARQGLEQRLVVHAADDPVVASDEAALAAILVDLDRPAEALVLAEHAVAVYRSADAWSSREQCEHDRVAALAVLATAHHRLGDAEAAAATYRETLAAKELLLGATHPELVPTLNNLGVLLADLGDLDGAATAYARAMDLLADAGLTDHPQAAAIARNLDVLDHRRSSGHPR